MDRQSTQDAATPEEFNGAWGGGFDAARHGGSPGHRQLNRAAPHIAVHDEDSRSEAETTLPT